MANRDVDTQQTIIDTTAEQAGEDKANSKEQEQLPGIKLNGVYEIIDNAKRMLADGKKKKDVELYLNNAIISADGKDRIMLGDVLTKDSSVKDMLGHVFVPAAQAQIALQKERIVAAQDHIKYQYDTASIALTGVKWDEFLQKDPRFQVSGKALESALAQDPRFIKQVDDYDAQKHLILNGVMGAIGSSLQAFAGDTGRYGTPDAGGEALKAGTEYTYLNYTQRKQLQQNIAIKNVEIFNKYQGDIQKALKDYDSAFNTLEQQAMKDRMKVIEQAIKEYGIRQKDVNSQREYITEQNKAKLEAAKASEKVLSDIDTATAKNAELKQRAYDTTATLNTQRDIANQRTKVANKKLEVEKAKLKIQAFNATQTSYALDYQVAKGFYRMDDKDILKLSAGYGALSDGKLSPIVTAMFAQPVPKEVIRRYGGIAVQKAQGLVNEVIKHCDRWTDSGENACLSRNAEIVGTLLMHGYQPSVKLISYLNSPSFKDIEDRTFSVGVDLTRLSSKLGGDIGDEIGALVSATRRYNKTHDKTKASITNMVMSAKAIDLLDSKIQEMTPTQQKEYLLFKRKQQELFSNVPDLFNMRVTEAQQQMAPLVGGQFFISLWNTAKHTDYSNDNITSIEEDLSE